MNAVFVADYNRSGDTRAPAPVNPERRSITINFYTTLEMNYIQPPMKWHLQTTSSIFVNKKGLFLLLCYISAVGHLESQVLKK